MTDHNRTSTGTASETLGEQVDRVEDDAEAMERYDRAIPLPDESEEDDDGVGSVTRLVP